MALIDVHNHILSKAWVDLLAAYGGQRYQISRDPEGRTIVLRKGARFLGLTDAMFDPEMRLRAMDEVGVQTQPLSYTCPNCYWADGKAAETVVRTMNDHMAEVCARWPDRFRGLGSLPMQDVDLALKELERAVDQLGMVCQQDPVRAVADDIPGQLLYAVPAQQAHHFVAELAGQVPGLAGELQADVRDSAVRVLDVYPDALLLGHGRLTRRCTRGPAPPPWRR